MNGLPQNTGIDTVAFGGSYSASEHFELGDDVQIRYMVDAQTITVVVPGRTTTFTADEGFFIPNSEFVFEKQNSAGERISRLNISRPIVDGVALTYARYGVFTYSEAFPNGDFAYFAFGQTTENDAMPRTGSANYTTLLDGMVVAPIEGGGSTGYYRLDPDGATLSANFETMSVATTILLSATGEAGTSGETRNFGTLIGAGSIAATGPGFNGTFSNTGVVGAFTGSFFGPQANEAGYIFNATGPDFTAVTGSVFGDTPTPPWIP